MLDIHTHILPQLDDGSSSVDESKKMLGMLSEQGVDTIVATPHFYIDGTEIEHFLELRKKSLDSLIPATAADRPSIALGAEVEFLPGLYTMDNIEKLCISGTSYMLIEMPHLAWSGYFYTTLSKLYSARGIKPIIAHVERYFEFQQDEPAELLRKLKDCGALIQINSSFLMNKQTKRTAIKLVKQGLISFMGSDCHNMETRPPQLREGFDIIYKKAGDKGLDAFFYWETKLKEGLETF